MMNTLILKVDKVMLNRTQPNRIASKGFTLIEVMVAMSIIAIVLVSIYRLHSQTILMQSQTRFYSIAPLLAQQKISDFDNMAKIDLADDNGDFGDEYPAYIWQATVITVDAEVLGLLSEDMFRIDITISSIDDMNTFQLRGYRFVQY
jgi:general secretion pathway protein I